MTIDGKIFILEDENRLKELVVKILRRQGNEVIVSGAPIDKEYVMQRSPQLGNGLKIKPLRRKDKAISNSKGLSMEESMPIIFQQLKKIFHLLTIFNQTQKQIIKKKLQT